MKRAVTRLIGTVVLGVLSSGISMGGITGLGSRQATAPSAEREADGLRELLNFIYQCRDCGGDREQRGDNSHFAFGGGSVYHALIMELAPGGISLQQLWSATSPAKTAGPAAIRGGATNQEWSEVGPAGTIAYLGGVPGSFVSSSSRAFEGGGNGRGQSKGLGHIKHDTLAAVPEPAPILLLGTILLATFSIARLRFNR